MNSVCCLVLFDEVRPDEEGVESKESSKDYECSGGSPWYPACGWWRNQDLPPMVTRLSDAEKQAKNKSPPYQPRSQTSGGLPLLEAQSLDMESLTTTRDIVVESQQLDPRRPGPINCQMSRTTSLFVQELESVNPRFEPLRGFTRGWPKGPIII
jgi:hypothetical protein